jgi:carbon storage regulator
MGRQKENLRRDERKSIVIGGNIVVKVVRVEGDQIKLGIQAPREVPVHREEVQKEIPQGRPAAGAGVLKAILGLPA